VLPIDVTNWRYQPNTGDTFVWTSTK